MSTPVITVCGLSKRYGRVVAVDNVTLDVQPGEVYALLGLNGAGKTTLIRMLLGMVRPTTGSLEVTARPVGDRSVWSQVGYLVESPSAYPELTVRENLEVVRRLRKVDDRSYVDDAIDLFGLRPYAGRRARALSLGNVQRLGLAKAFMHRPSLLLLDEPVNSLDPAGVVEVRDLLVSLARDHGVTVFLSCHRLGEVARVASLTMSANSTKISTSVLRIRLSKVASGHGRNRGGPSRWWSRLSEDFSAAFSLVP